MMYNMNDFPEGTNIKQRLFRPIDMQQNSVVYWGAFGSNPFMYNTEDWGGNLKDFVLYNHDFSKVTMVDNPFMSCQVICGDVFDIDFSNLKKMSNLFKSTTTASKIIVRNMRNINNISEFIYASGFYVDEIEFVDCDFSNCTSIQYFFDTNNCVGKMGAINNISNPNLTLTNFTQSQTKLVEFGGFIGLKAKIEIHNWSALNYESCINVLNGLHDFVSAGETPTSKQGILKVHSNFLSLVGDEIAIATNKGWQVTA